MPKDIECEGFYIEIRLKEASHKHTPHCHVHFNDGSSLWVSLVETRKTVRTSGKVKAKNLAVALKAVDFYFEELTTLWEERHG